ncbi:MAG: DUF362 domain-containing protein [Desulfobacterales bacterium]|nr:DUF362 domain-containing protein [Desulfobacterales bacterium]
MKSKVYFIDFRVTPRENIFGKIGRLLEEAGLSKIISDRDLTALKIHFGERGNTAFIRPVYVAQIAEAVKKAGGSPFLTDTNTLYAGTRSDAPSHLKTAIKNGFTYSTVEVPVVIADGLRGASETVINSKGKHFKKFYIGSEIYNADAMISIAHFKGHELAGFGGALKNIGMGCASRKGKLAQHSTVSPKVKRKLCVACEDCLSHCAVSAISMKDEKASINNDTCVGCGECILICPSEAIQIQWNQSIPVFLEGMIEYTKAALDNKKDKTLYINFINSISPACDCADYSDSPIVHDIGIVASTDPVAIDTASADLVNSKKGIESSALTTNLGEGEDKFKGLYPAVDWPLQLKYAEELGIGTRSYDLITIDPLRWKQG